MGGYFSQGDDCMRIKSIAARQILDSRGQPTLEARVTLTCGAEGVASAPSGASTGAHEAHELRDGGSAYGGRSVERAVAGVNGEICAALTGLDVRDQRGIDAALIALDGTPNKSRLGGNALIAVSLACAVAASKTVGMPLWRYIGGVSGGRCPCPMMNVLNGGAHAANNVDIQEFMLVPVGAASFADAVRMCAETYQALKSVLRERGLSIALGDEGGFAPDLRSDEEALELLMLAIGRAGCIPGKGMAIALDVAASEWADAGEYHLPKRGERRSRKEMIEYFSRLTQNYPIVSLEDPLGEEDFAGFAEITRQLGDSVMIVGDDLFTTNPARLRKGIDACAANAILLKPNQIGTLSETIDAVRIARGAGYRLILSHRSGETESSIIADLACAVNADFLKAGAPARSERTAKYNRVLAIELDW